METKKTLTNSQFWLKVTDEKADNNKRDVSKAFLSSELTMDNTNTCKTCSNKDHVRCVEQSIEAFSAEIVLTDFMEYDYCCLCRGIFECSQLVNVSVVALKECFPEMRRRENYKYKSCELCQQSLQDFHAFSITCTTSTRKIHEFSSILNITPQDVNLYEVYQFLCSSSTSEDTKNILTSAIQIKDEEDSTVNSIEEDSSQHKSPTEMEVYKKRLFETKPKDCVRKYLLVDTQIFKCELCPYETKYKRSLKQHKLIHKDSSEIELFKCELCAFETKYRHSIKKHSLIHQRTTTFTCELCLYETKREYNLQQHSLIHKDATEKEVFKCELCPFETERKFKLKRHSLVHKDATKIEMFKCDRCPFETNRKYELKRHSSIHKDPTKIEMLKCEHCPYETKCKRNFKRHALVHKSRTETEMFKCELCSYEAKQKYYLKQHTLNIHKNSDGKKF